MDNLEKVEKIREKTGVSYEEAKNVLEANNYDLLDAIVELERQGKVKSPETPVYTTEAGQKSQEFARTQQQYENDCRKKSSGDAFNHFFKRIGDLLKKTCETSFEVIRNEKRLVTVPVIVLIFGAVLAFWVTIPLLIVGMFFGCKYHFAGFDSTTVDINDICDKASETCESIKNDFQNEMKKEDVGEKKE